MNIQMICAVGYFENYQCAIIVLQHSYGFIQCCDREARLFFHFSEYAGKIDDVSVGGVWEALSIQHVLNTHNM